MAIYVKAFSLILKTASKPLAKRLKHVATSNAFLRGLCISAALKVDAVYQGVMAPAAPEGAGLSSGGRRMKLDKTPRQRVMTEEQALNAATDFLGEAFVFGVAGGLIWWEQDKSAQKDKAKTVWGTRARTGQSAGHAGDVNAQHLDRPISLGGRLHAREARRSEPWFVSDDASTELVPEGARRGVIVMCIVMCMPRAFVALEEWSLSSGRRGGGASTADGAAKHAARHHQGPGRNPGGLRAVQARVHGEERV